MLDAIKQTTRSLQQEVEVQNETNLTLKLFEIHNQLYNISWYNRHQHPESTTSAENRITEEKYVVKSYAHRQNSVFFNTNVEKKVENGDSPELIEEEDTSFFNILFQ